MAQPKHLPRAPITEAVIDFRARLDANFEVNKFKALEAAVGYDRPEEMTSFQFGFHQLPGQTPQTHQVNLGTVGWRFTSSDKKKVVQFRKDGFTFSRLAPYPNEKCTYRYLGRGEILTSSVQKAGLQTQPDTLPPRRHAVINNWPPLTKNRKHDETCWMVYAKRLLEASRYVGNV